LVFPRIRAEAAGATVTEMVKFSAATADSARMGDVLTSGGRGPEWLRVQQAAELLGVSASTLRRWADSGKVASLRTPGGQRRFSRVELVSLLTPRAAGDSDAGASAARHEQDRRLALLFEATRAVTSSLVLEDVLELVTRTTAEAMGTFAADIFDYSASENAMVASGYWALDITAEDEDYLGFRISLDERPGYYPFIDEPRLIERQLDADDWPPGEREIAARWDEKSGLMAPLLYGGELIGLLGCTERRFVRHFTAEDKEFLQLLALPAALAIHNAQAFREQEERARRLATLRDCGRAVTSSLHVDEVLATLARTAATALGSPECVIFDYDAVADTLTARALYEDDPRGYDGLGVPSPLADWPSDRVLLENRTIVVETISDPDIPPDARDSMKRWGGRTCLNVPLYFGDEPLGILVLIETQRERVFTREDTELMGAVAEQAAVAIHNARQYERVKRLHLGNLKALSSALSAKDYYTLGHAGRVSAYMTLLGRELGWADERLAEVQDAAYLHDIGKIAVSDRVLLKAGPLNREEWELMRQHPGISAEIVRPLFNEELTLAVRHHHERFDGDGYPDGMAGDAIPLVARAMCLVDAYDAMSCSRPYRVGLTRRQCLDEMARCSGAQFDPEMVATFVRALERLEGRRRWGVAVAEQAAALIDPDRHALLWSRADEARPEYAEMVGALRQLREASPPARFITTFAVRGGTCVAVLDTGETAEDLSHVGDLWLPHDELAAVLSGDGLDTNVVNADEFGVWVTCVAPVRSGGGDVTAAVTVDMPAVESGSLQRFHRDMSHDLLAMLQAASVRWSRAELEAITDGLTSLYNHRYLQVRLDEELERARMEEEELSVLFIDLDEFKTFNDSRGHKAGDEILRRVARAVEKRTRRIDLVARYGGDEFVVALLGTGPAEAVATAERIRDGIRAEAADDGSISVSIGVASFPGDAAAKAELLDKADWAMYSAKRAGRDQVVAFKAAPTPEA
jgi:diguanylate cyclase (GGDEF)-like protein/excisionase family DNA binding protein